MAKYPDIPQMTKSRSIGEFLNGYIPLFKSYFPKPYLSIVMGRIGLGSRISVNQVATGKRQFSAQKVKLLTKTFDLSQREREFAQALSEGELPPVDTSSPKYVLGTNGILSHPINTIVLNLCAVTDKPTREQIKTKVAFFWDAATVDQKIDELIATGHMRVTTGDRLERIDLEVAKLSSPNGLFVDFAEDFTKSSMDLAKQAWMLDCGEREFTTFTAKIKADDFPKLKDLVRDFRAAIYALSEDRDTDCVVHVNANAFMLGAAQMREATK